MINRIMVALSMLLAIPVYGVSLKSISEKAADKVSSIQEKLSRKIDQFRGNKQALPDLPKDQETRNQLIEFLSTDPAYRGNRDLQYGFLGRFNLNNNEKQDLINKVIIKEQYTF